MEYDRYQQNSKLFVIGIICLLMSLALLAFGLYILPYLLWNWGYNVPEFVLSWREWLKEEYSYSDQVASWLVICVFLVPAIFCGYISQWISNYIDNQIYGIEKPSNSPEEEMEVKKDLHFGLKIALLIILVLVLVALVQWLLLGL